MVGTTDIARVAAPQRVATAARLTRRQKAAIIVRFLLNEGAKMPLDTLPEPLQEVLTTQMGSMRYVDRGTLGDVVTEFAGELEAMGLVFPHGVAGAINMLDGQISAQTAARLRKEAGVRQFGDPWEQVRQATPEQLLPILLAESTEVAAVILSKLDVSPAADLLGRMPGDRARRLTYSVSQTGNVTPDAVDRIGLALAMQLGDIPVKAFPVGPVQRIGAILNSSPQATRDDVLSGLEEEDMEFAIQVRRAIFTFANIPERLRSADISKALREVDQAVLVTALAAASGGPLSEVGDYLLDNMTKRMADTLREEVEETGRVKTRPGEEAMTEVVNAIRRLEAAGEITLRTPEEDGDEDTEERSGDQ